MWWACDLNREKSEICVLLHKKTERKKFHYVQQTSFETSCQPYNALWYQIFISVARGITKALSYIYQQHRMHFLRFMKSLKFIQVFFLMLQIFFFLRTCEGSIYFEHGNKLFFWFIVIIIIIMVNVRNNLINYKNKKIGILCI